MVRVRWDTSTGDLVEVIPGDGPNQYSDDVNPKLVEEKLNNTERISEVTIAASVAGVYDGPASSDETLVTTETYSEPNSGEISTTLAFVEIADLIKKLEQITCGSCSHSPEDGGDWTTRERDGERLEYTDWICPDCGTVVHTEAY